MPTSRSTRPRGRWAAGFLFLGILAGCGANRIYLTIDPSLFQPSLDRGQFAEYAAAGMVRLTINNRADNTSLFSFFSRDGRFEYGYPGTITRSLAIFLTSCYQSLFSAIGVAVSDSSPVAIPEITVDFTFWDDLEMRYSVILARADGLIYQKNHVVTMPAPTAREISDYALLKKRIYHMIEKSFTTLVEDPGFKAALLKKPAD